MKRTLIYSGREYHRSDRQSWQRATSLDAGSRVRVIDARPWGMTSRWGGATGAKVFQVEDGRCFTGGESLLSPDDFAEYPNRARVNAVIVEVLDVDTGAPTGRIIPVRTAHLRDTWDAASKMIRANAAAAVARLNADNEFARARALRLERIRSVIREAALDKPWITYSTKVVIEMADLEAVLAEHVPGWQPYTDGETP